MRFVSFETVEGTDVCIDKNKVNAVLSRGIQIINGKEVNVVTVYIDGDKDGYNVVNPLGEVMDYLEEGE